MKFIKAKSYSNLFVKCIISSIILNFFFFLIALPFSTQNPWLFLEAAQMCSNLFLGLFIRKTNQEFFLQNPSERKKYSRISLVVLIFSLFIYFDTDIISMLYHDIIMFIYNTTGIDKLLSLFDLISISICLGSVFFYSERLSRKFGKKRADPAQLEDTVLPNNR